MKLTRQVAPVIKEWCDALFFVNYKIYVVTTENNTKKAQGGKRVLYTTHNPTYDAKNRFGLPEELELNFESIAHLFEGQEETKKVVITPEIPSEVSAAVERLNKMIIDTEVTEADIQRVVASKGHYKADESISKYSDEFITRWIIPNWEKIVKTIKNKKGE
jgi:hypothetical protein